MAVVGEGAQSTVVELFRHNTWANLKLIAACEGLSKEQLDATVGGTFGTIRDTLGHIIGAELGYVRRVNGRMRDPLRKRGEFPGFDALKADASWCGDEMAQLALTAGPNNLVRETWEGQVAQYPLTSLMTQAVTHSCEHRTQVATILTQQGIEPPDMSGWAYMVETGQFTETPE
jgi:uncharacterized damage-inducible protein DinB